MTQQQLHHYLTLAANNINNECPNQGKLQQFANAQTYSEVGNATFSHLHGILTADQA